MKPFAVCCCTRGVGRSSARSRSSSGLPPPSVRSSCCWVSRSDTSPTSVRRCTSCRHRRAPLSTSLPPTRRSSSAEPTARSSTTTPVPPARSLGRNGSCVYERGDDAGMGGQRTGPDRRAPARARRARDTDAGSWSDLRASTDVRGMPNGSSSGRGRSCAPPPQGDPRSRSRRHRRDRGYGISPLCGR